MSTTGGIHSLDTLMASLEVSLLPGIWRFETGELDADNAQAVMTFREREGNTFILPAAASTPTDNRWAWIEVSVHSDLNAVGFLAALAAALAENSIPCNAVAAFYHDHIFVPERRATEAIAALEALREG